MARRGAEQLEQGLLVRSEPGLGGEEPLELGDRRLVVGPVGQLRVVEQVAQRLGRGVLVGDAGDQQFLQRRLRLLDGGRVLGGERVGDLGVGQSRAVGELLEERPADGFRPPRPARARTA